MNSTLNGLCVGVGVAPLLGDGGFSAAARTKPNAEAISNIAASAPRSFRFCIANFRRVRVHLKVELQLALILTGGQNAGKKFCLCARRMIFPQKGGRCFTVHFEPLFCRKFITPGSSGTRRYNTAVGRLTFNILGILNAAY